MGQYEGEKFGRSLDLDSKSEEMRVETGVTAAIIRRARSLASGTLPPKVRLIAKHCLVDWCGVALAGTDEPLVRILTEMLLAEGCKPAASVVGNQLKFSLRQAALLNGATGHAIDYDDVNMAASAHITAAILPATLAASEMAGSSGDGLLRAFIGGYEATVMIGRFLGREHYDRGFHATATAGTCGAAAASALALGLDTHEMAVAIGIAATQAAGLKAQFGTMCKPFHAGKSNENGLSGTLLARRGFTGRTDILECVQGFADTHGGAGNAEAALAAPRSFAHICDNLFKYSAACYGTHGAILAAGQLRREHSLTPDIIGRVELDVEPGADRMCNIEVPLTGLESKFSLRFNTALAFANEDTSSPALYCDAITRRQDLSDLRSRVVVNCMPPGWPNTLTEVRVQTTDGRWLKARHDTGIPEEDLAQQAARVRHKFLGLSTPVLGSSHASALHTMIENIDRQESLEPLFALLRGEWR